GAVAADLGESYPGQKRGLMDWSTLDNLNQDIAKAIEGADVGAVEKVVTDHAYMLVKVEDRKKAATTPLKKAAPEIAEKLLRKQRAEAFVDGAADKLLKAARNSDSLDAALKKLGSSDEKLWSALSVSTTGDFTLETTNMGARLRGRLSGMNFGGSWAKIPGIGKSKELSTLAYSELSADNPVPNKTFEVGGAVHVVRLKSKKKPEDKSGLEMRVKQQLEKTSDIIGSWNGIFQMPAEEYGPWIKKQFQAAVASGKITLATKNSQTAKLLANDFKPVGNKGKKGKGRTIKLSPGKGKKGKGRTIKLSPGKGKKGGGKKIKLNPGGGKKGGDDEGGGKKIKLKMGGSNKKGGE
ncbi:MAG: peptidylprolyl isomerase, partial [Bradymonadaceae bacterium]